MKKLVVTSFFIILTCIHIFGQNRYYLKLEDKSIISSLCDSCDMQTCNDSFNDFLKEYGAKSCNKAFPNAKSEWLNSIVVLHCSKTIEKENVKKKLGNIISLVEKIEEVPDMVGACIPNDINQNQTTYLNLIRASEAWEIACGLPMLPMAINDVSFNIDHEDIADNVVGSDGSAHDVTDFHGTAVAGLASAVSNNGIGIAGTSMNAAMYLSAQNWADNSKILSLATQGYRVINCCWLNSCQYSVVVDSLYKEIRDVWNTVVVFGAGNSDSHCGSRSAFVYPASYDYVVSVTSVGHLNERGYVSPIWGMADWKDCHEAVIGDTTTTYHHNSKVDICAPGYNVYSTYSNNSYSGTWGTSFAAPLVSGTINIMASVNPCLTAEELIDMIKSTSDASIYNIPENANYIGLLGDGRLDMYEAVNAAAESATENITTTYNVNTPTVIQSNYAVKVQAPLNINSSSLLIKTRKFVEITDELTVLPNCEFTIDVKSDNIINCNN